MQAGRAGLPLAIALSLVFLAQGLLGNRDKSLTWDEPRYIAAGYASLTQNEFRLNPSHPPFLQELLALPLLSLEPEVPPEGVEHWLARRNSAVGYGNAFVFGVGLSPSSGFFLSLQLKEHGFGSLDGFLSRRNHIPQGLDLLLLLSFCYFIFIFLFFVFVFCHFVFHGKPQQNPLGPARFFFVSG